MKNQFIESQIEFLKPEKVVEALPLKNNFIVADFGCGSGFFTVTLAEKVPKGLVVGIDILLSSLEALSLKIREQGIKNVNLILGDLEKEKGSGLKDESCDLVFIGNVLFQVEDKKAILKEAVRVLKKGGFLVIIDWGENALLGPAKELRLSKRQVVQIVRALGLKKEKEFEAGQFHFGLIFKK